MDIEQPDPEKTRELIASHQDCPRRLMDGDGLCTVL
jgi:hypothetical protein